MEEIESDELSFEVGESAVGLRADKYLTMVCEDLSRSRLQSLIQNGDVSINGGVLANSSKKLELNDLLTVRVPPPVPCQPEPEDIPLEIIFEDENLLVVNKAAGMVVHPGAGNWTGTLVNALLHHCGESLSGIGGVVRPGIVHRLDKDTSGLMMVAKNDYAHQYLSAQLSDRSLSRVYHALVLGVPVPIKGVVDRPIGRHRHNRLKMSVMSNAPREAVTHYRVLKDYRGAAALVECSLETGRTHQIRVHLEALGHCLVGDPLYGAQPNQLASRFKNARYDTDVIDKILDFSRQFLHAKAIEFIHPETEEEMFFECELPEDMASILDALEK